MHPGVAAGPSGEAVATAAGSELKVDDLMIFSPERAARQGDKGLTGK
jgi:hypothetical protein